MYFNGDLDIKNEAKREDYIDNWMNLVIGVISKASDDYRLERKRMLKIEKELRSCMAPERRETLLKDLRSVRTTVNSLRQFFLSSPWLRVIHTDGSYILAELDKEVR